MLQNLTGWHALIVLAVVILVFGAAKLPALARSLGQSVRILRSEVGEAHASYFDGVARVIGADVYKLDGDGDGWACNG